MYSFFEIIQQCPLFAEIADADLQKLLTCLSAAQRSYAKGEPIFIAGDTIHSVGVVLSGGVHITQEDYWGNRTILAHVEPGQLFGEAFSCAEIDSLPVSGVAAEASMVLLLDYARIITTCSHACNFHTQLVKNMLKTIARKNILLTQKMEIVAHRTTKERLLAYLSAQALRAGRNRFTIPFNRQELADYLSVERSAMSTVLSQMQAEGLLRTNKNEFEIFSCTNKI